MKLLLSISLFLATVNDIQALVDDDFSNCLKYFYKNHVPTGFEDIAQPDRFDRNNFPDGMNRKDLNSPAYICQMFEGTSWYATLYDRGRLMPLYSAYIMDVNHGETPKECSRPQGFKLEPQLVYRGVSGDMTRDAFTVLKNYNKEKGIDQTKEKNRPPYLLKRSQAGDNDYPTGDYDKGHLSPCGHHSAVQDEYKATFTFTNVAPMIKELNNNIWSQYEIEMIKMSAQCKQMYVITGVVPGNVRVPRSRLIAPAYMWNAYCCIDNNDKPFFSGAAVAENIKHSQLRKFQNVGDFQSELKRLLGVSDDIVLFHNNCSP
ncbi:endonuclease domain-containing 1 protein-like [Leptodactylus fuscus]|uniref:endonuclease domain-containing 1 protein-like n=1 Tax=Leptodactylus fuscus TaxID=238119 RepID=UPI003F4E79CE